MYTLSRSLPVNDADTSQPRLTREDIWNGLMVKARDALPFVPLMTKCEVVEEYEAGLLREIVFAGQPMAERITFYPKQRVQFDRVGGPEPGVIYNDIEEDEDGSLHLRFTFSLEAEGIEPGSREEEEHFQQLERSYLNAVAATLAHLRELKSSAEGSGTWEA
jgi:hypothetical protein